MAYKSIKMESIDQIILYSEKGYGIKKISRIMGMSKNTIKKYLRRHELVEKEEKTHGSTSHQFSYLELEKKEKERELGLTILFPKILKELSRVGVTRELLWQDYIKENPNGYSYSRFCHRLKKYRLQSQVTLRLEHKAAYKITVDFAGKKMSWVDINGGEIHICEILVCTLPYSGYTYVCALASQQQQDFITGLNKALQYFGGIPKVLLSDNLKSFVNKPCRYDPTFTKLMHQFSTHYGIELEATRAYKPKDKAHVERHVGIVYRQIYAPLRDELITSIEELNRAIEGQLEHLNKKNYQGKDYSRMDKFLEEEKEFLMELPNKLFEIRKKTKAKVQNNYHVMLGEDKHLYSVPYQQVSNQTEIIYTSQTVEIYYKMERIAVHKRDYRAYGYTTLAIHMPEKHLKHIESKGWDAEYFKKKAEQIGAQTLAAIESILESKILVEQTYRACVGVFALGNTYGNDRLERASQMANERGRARYGVLKSILKNCTDKLPLKKEQNYKTVKHENIRGKDFF